MTASFIASFFAGLLSFVSPCVLPLVPAYLCYLAGSSFEELLEGASSRALRLRITVASFLFVAGFSTVFVLLGASASAIGQTLRIYQDALSKIAGGVLLLFGLHFLGLLWLPFLNFEKRFIFPRADNPFSAYGMGLAFAFGWTPCIGPVLAAILAVAAREESVGQGMLLLTSYSLGLGLPFFVAGAAIPLFLRFAARARKHLHLFEKIAGAGLVITGALFLSGDFTHIAAWLIDMFPGLARLG
jgi:cytochrome c-type biogenesis protein